MKDLKLIFRKFYFSLKTVHLELGESLSTDIKDYVNQEIDNVRDWKIDLSKVNESEVGTYKINRLPLKSSVPLEFEAYSNSRLFGSTYEPFSRTFMYVDKEKVPADTTEESEDEVGEE